MTFTIELPPGTTYADLGRHLDRIALNFNRADDRKPEHDERIDIYDPNGSAIGQWSITK